MNGRFYIAATDVMNETSQVSFDVNLKLLVFKLNWKLFGNVEKCTINGHLIKIA